MAKKVENDEEKNKQVSIKAINLVIFAFCLIVFLQTAFIITKWFINNVKSEQLISEIKKEVVTEPKENEEDESLKNPIDFEKLIEQNEDTVGWIQIDDTNIDYPIVKAEDNEYYLQKDFNKKTSSCGWIFMDYKNNGEFIDKNTVLYGHNLKSDYMFADLQKIYNNEIDSSTVIKVYTPKEMLKYRIYSCYMIDSEDTYATKSNIVTEDDTENYIKEILKRSEHQYNVVPDKSGKLLTLSTCDRTGQSRILVHCVYIGSERY